MLAVAALVATAVIPGCDPGPQYVVGLPKISAASGIARDRFDLAKVRQNIAALADAKDYPAALSKLTGIELMYEFGSREDWTPHIIAVSAAKESSRLKIKLMQQIGEENEALKIARQFDALRDESTDKLLKLAADLDATENVPIMIRRVQFRPHYSGTEVMDVIVIDSPHVARLRLYSDNKAYLLADEGMKNKLPLR